MNVLLYGFPPHCSAPDPIARIVFRLLAAHKEIWEQPA
jgi:hypothetical protein